MTNKSLTVIRNAKVVGKNSKSYNDKHPENPIIMRPIRAAKKIIRYVPPYFFRDMKNLSRTEIAQEIARYTKGNSK